MKFLMKIEGSYADVITFLFFEFLKRERYFSQKNDFWRLSMRYMSVMGINRTDLMRRNRGCTLLLKFLKEEVFFYKKLISGGSR